MRVSIRKYLIICLVLAPILAAGPYTTGSPGEYVQLEGTAYDVADSAGLRAARLLEYRQMLSRAKECYLLNEKPEAIQHLAALKTLLSTDDLVRDDRFRREVELFAGLLGSDRQAVRLSGALRDAGGDRSGSDLFIFQWFDHPVQLEAVRVAPGDYTLLVDKIGQRLHVYQFGNSWDRVKSYLCTTGKSSGDKLKEGDMRTPEGIYYFNRIFEDSDLHSIYGIRAFVTNYPDSVDVKRGKSGDGIWLHGLDRPLVPNDTNGCIALRNSDIRDISGYIKLTSTPLVVSRRLQPVGPVVRSYSIAEITGFLRTFQSSWEAKDMAAFRRLFSDGFLGGGEKREDYFRRKLRFARHREWIKVEISNLTVRPGHDRVEVRFEQAYSSPVYSDRGRKRLILRLEKGGWRIWDEIWEG